MKYRLKKWKSKMRFNPKKSFLFVILFLILSTFSVGYAYLTTNLDIDGTSHITGATWDVHFANIVVDQTSVTATTPAAITNDTTIDFSVNLKNPGDVYTFTADIVNAGTLNAMVDSITLSPELTTDQQEYLTYEVSYSNGVPIEANQLLEHGSSKNIKVSFQYKNLPDFSLYPEDDQNLTISISITYVQADGNAVEVPPSRFNMDSLGTFRANLEAGNTDIYEVGDTKEIDLGTYGVHTLRIANRSTPAECEEVGFSQTACGFVIEFADIITNRVMYPAEESPCGYLISEIRTFLNNDLYNSLPTDLQRIILDTPTITGNPNGGGSSVVTSTEKIYLLTAVETHNYTNSDAGASYTRQLDYYANLGVTSSDYSAAIKRKSNGSTEMWWLRSGSTNSFTEAAMHIIDYDGSPLYVRRQNASFGVSPAFRIGLSE